MFRDRLPMMKVYPNFCLTQSLLKALLLLTNASRSQAVLPWIPGTVTAKVTGTFREGAWALAGDVAKSSPGGCLQRPAN